MEPDGKMALFRGVHPRMSNVCVTIPLSKESTSSVTHLSMLKGKKPPGPLRSVTELKVWVPDGPLSKIDGLVWTRAAGVQHWGSCCPGSDHSSPTPG